MSSHIAVQIDRKELLAHKALRFFLQNRNVPEHLTDGEGPVWEQEVCDVQLLVAREMIGLWRRVR